MGVGKRGVLDEAVPVQAKEAKKPVRRGAGTAVPCPYNDEKQVPRVVRDDRRCCRL
jgi:hypothetical protein